MTETERSLLDAVLENPDDDLPRLVYADWLDENGNPMRAEFIRAQIALSQSVLRSAYDSDEYVHATKQIMKTELSDIIQFMFRDDVHHYANRYIIDVYEEVIRLRNKDANVYWHIERGFIFNIQSSYDWMKKNCADFILFPVNRFNFSIGHTSMNLSVRKEDNTWISSVTQSGRLVTEKPWPSRSHCFIEMWNWTDQTLERTSL